MASESSEYEVVGGDMATGGTGVILGTPRASTTQ